MKTENSSCMIDIYRLLFTIGICLMHFETAYFYSENRIFEGCYLGVEFFFVLSGYLLAKTFESKKYKNAEIYTLTRIKELMPYHICIIICFYIWYIWQMVLSTNGGEGIFLEVIRKGISFFYEVIFLHMFLPSGMVNGPTWYLSVLLVIGYAYYFYLGKEKKSFGGVLY